MQARDSLTTMFHELDALLPIREDTIRSKMANALKEALPRQEQRTLLQSFADDTVPVTQLTSPVFVTSVQALLCSLSSGVGPVFVPHRPCTYYPVVCVS